MDNEFGIMGYNKIKKRKYSINNIFCDTFLYCLLLLLISFLPFCYVNANIFFYITDFVVSLILYIIFILIKFNKNNVSFTLHIYFKDKECQQNFLHSNYHLKESVNIILENNIKPIKNNNYNSIIFEINNNNKMNIYNKLKDRYEIMNL